MLTYKNFILLISVFYNTSILAYFQKHYDAISRCSGLSVLSKYTELFIVSVCYLESKLSKSNNIYRHGPKRHR
jgi:hypothetical protein